MAPTRSSRLASAFAASVLVVLLGASSALFGLCGPFTDVAADAFCPFVLEIFYLGITTGTTPTTYDPTSNVNRLQMAAFLSRSVDGVLKRGSRRAALGRFWTPQDAADLGLTTVASDPGLPASDGADVWVPGNVNVSRVRGSDGKLLETWTAVQGSAALTAIGKVFVAGGQAPGILYRMDPSQPAGAATTVASNLGGYPQSLAYDGSRFWTANGIPGSVSIVTPGATIPWTVTTVTTGLANALGAIYDGANVWVTNNDGGALLKLDSSGAILQTVTVGAGPARLVFDGTSIWVPNNGSDSVTVVRASNGAVLATLTGNGLSAPNAGAFDGQRVLIVNETIESVSLWKAADLTPLGSFSIGTSTGPWGACSDGVNFWITLSGANRLARF
jgi:hypothetical protein